MTNYINSIKGLSSRILFQEFPEIKMKLWKGHLWSRSYCLLTTVNNSKVLSKDSKLLAAISMWNDIIQACSKEEETNCNCVIDNLNAMSYLTPVGKNTQTRKIFNGMLTQFEIFKNKQLLTNCTKKLRPI